MTNVPASAAEMEGARKESTDFDPSRIRSLDAFRGLAIMLLLFFSDLLTVEGIPAWLQPAAVDANHFTVADIMFPLFLFIAGLSIPIAVVLRMDGGAKPGAVWKHMGMRCFALLVIGVYMANMASFHRSSTIGENLWNTLFYAGVILVWTQYPQKGKSRFLFKGLTLLGIAILVYLNLSYNGGDGSENMQARWWGYLGLLGWAGLLAGTLYLLFKQNFTAMVAVAAMLVLFAVSFQSGKLELEGIYAFVVGRGNTIVYAVIVIAGILPGMLFTGQSTFSDEFRNRYLFVAAALLAAAGWLLQPLYGISQLNATPSWALYSAALCCLTFALVYFIVEVRKITLGLRFLERAGRNALMAFMLWGLVLALGKMLGLGFLDPDTGQGAMRILRAAGLALVMTAAASYLAKFKIRIKL